MSRHSGTLLSWFWLSLVFICLVPCPVLSCQLGNKPLAACLHTYLERDFSIVEELLRRPPYGENGHILIEENELDQMCARIGEMKNCYEDMFRACTAYASYAHMKRILKTLRLIHLNLCSSSSWQIKNLIEGGYCIEFMRKEGVCSGQSPDPPADQSSHSTFDPSQLTSLPLHHRWPYTLSAMMRFELGHGACAYLSALDQCLSPVILNRCHEPSRLVWNHSLNTILDVWCNSHSSRPSIAFLSILSLLICNTFLFFYYYH